MATITTGSHPKALWPGIKAWWGRSYEEHLPEYPDLFEQDTSDKAYEEEPEITGFGLAPEKPQGQQIFYDTEIQGPVSRYTHVAYALGYIVTFEELRDDLYEVVARRRALADHRREPVHLGADGHFHDHIGRITPVTVLATSVTAGLYDEARTVE